MASDGKIIIETKLDTSGFEKDVDSASKKVVDDLGKGTEKAINSFEQSMKKASSAFDGSKISKQLDNVTKSIDNTSKKIELQQNKMSKLKQVMENATNPSQKNKLQRQIVDTEAAVLKLEGRLNGLKDKQVNLKIKMDSANGLNSEFHSASVKITEDLDKVEEKAEETGKKLKDNIKVESTFIKMGETIEKTGKSISDVGNNLTTKLTLPVVGLGVAASKIGMDFDSQMSRVKAISGATGEEFTKLHDQALQLGKDTAFSAKQASEGMENLASSGFNTEEIMSAMPGLLDLAASSGESLASSSDIAASTLRGFGLEASEAGHVADVLAKNAGATNAAVADTGEAMKYIAPVAHSMRLGLEEVTAAIGEMANNGIKGSQAGTTLRSALTRLASPAKEAKDAMAEIGFNAFDSQGKLKSLSQVMGEYSHALEGKTDQQKQDYTATIFGQEAMSGMLVLMEGGSNSLDDLTNSYKSADGAASEMAKTMQDNSKSAVEQMMGSVETTAIKLEEDFAPVIIQICNEIQELANAFSELSPEQQEFYAKLLLSTAAAGPALKVIGGLTSDVGSLINIVSKLAPVLGGTAGAEAVATGGLAGFGGALAAIAPVVLPVITALAALGIGIAAYLTVQDQMDDKLTRTTDDMTEWQKAINGMTGYTFKSKKELQDLGIEYKDFGNNISDNFKKKVEESTKTLQEFQLFLEKMNLDNIIDDSESDSFNNQIEKMVNDAIDTIDSKKVEAQKSISDLFKLDDNLIDDTEQKALDSLSKSYDNQVLEENQLKEDIIKIKQDAVNRKEALNQKEIKDIENKTERIKEIELESVGGTQEEQDYSKNEFGARVENVSATDASDLLKEKRKQLEEENVKIKASYDTQLDMLKSHLKDAAEEDKEAIQVEIDKYTKLRDEKTKLKQDEFQKYVEILKEKNPEALALVDEFNGEILTKEDKISQDRLSKLSSTYSELNSVTESGTYTMKNAFSGSMDEVTVKVDEATGKITGAFSTTTDAMGNTVITYGGYTAQMEQEAQNLGQEHMNLASISKKAMDDLTGAHVDASGKITTANGELIGSLKDVQTSEDGATKGIYDLNGTPIEVEVNKDGTISNLDSILAKIAEITKPRTVYIRTEQDDFDENRTHLNADGSVSSHYTGTSGGTEGLTTANEHGWEISTGEEAVYLMGSGSGIMDHMSSVNEMNKEINSQVSNSVGKVVSTLVSAINVQSSLLSQVADNTGGIVQNGSKTIQLNKELATNLVDKWSSNSSSFSGLSSEINKANNHKDKADNMKVEDNYWYSRSKSQLTDVESKIKDIEDQIDNTTDEAAKKQLESQKKVLENQKDYLQDSVDYYKDAAQKEIDASKETAEQEVKEANEKKEKLTKIAEAVTTAIKSQLEKQKSAGEKTINDQLSALETAYNSNTQEIEDSLKKKEDKIDEQIKALEEESTEDSRDQERTEAQDNIFVLKTKMANTSDQADKRSIELQIEKAQKELDEKEEGWSTEDQKSELEDEKTALETKAEKKKKALEEEYNTQKDSLEKQLKSVDEYYDKLLEEDSVNAKARYTLLNSNSQELVTLLNSYAPDWQNSGQSLADSLIDGLNSQKQNVQDAVSEIISLRDGSNSSDSDVTILQELKGYASGTDSNPVSGYYDVDENGFEISNGDNAVAYVSQGAAIRNHMSSEKFIKSEIAKQVELMRNSVMDQQAQMQSLFVSNSARNANNNNIVNNDNGFTLHVENLNLNTGQDVEQLASELGALTNRQKVN